MKNKNLILMGLCGISLLGFGHRAFADTNVGKVVGKLGFVEGDVHVDGKPAQDNTSVRVGSEIEVNSGKATLLLGKGSVFHLASDTKMVVNEFGVSPKGGSEEGELDLKFGRTRALILNQGTEKKDLKIKARAATMGVRGTEIFIDAPKDTGKPVQFFTLEGKADVSVGGNHPVIVLNQNQGVSAHSTEGGNNGGGTGNGGSSNGSGNSGSKANGANAGTNGANPAPNTTTTTATMTTSAATMTVSDVNNTIQNSGMQSQTVNTPQDIHSNIQPGNLSDQFGMGSTPPVILDPLQDRFTPVQIVPKFCSATGPCP